MRIHITTGTKERFDHAIPYATCAATALADHYTHILQDAYNNQTDTLYLQGFHAMGNMERAIVEFLHTHEFPKDIEIITENEETSTMYKVVYNFWFAQEKSARMEDDSWD